MNKILIAIAVSLLAGLAVGAYIVSDRKPQHADPSSADGSVYFDQSAATEDRIRALEQAVAEERDARQLLEEELQILYGEIERLGSPPDALTAEPDAGMALQREAVEERMRRFQARNSPEGRISMLIEAGFSPGRAEWIVKRESELQMRALQAQFEARRSGEPTDWMAARLRPDALLRAEIGDTEYEQYLQASGRPTAVAIGNILESSPGQRAGLQVGDQIVAYGGERVYNYWELSERTMQGDPGQTVVVDIIRDGVAMQVVLPQGPIGISESRGRWRR